MRLPEGRIPRRLADRFRIGPPMRSNAFWTHATHGVYFPPLPPGSARVAALPGLCYFRLLCSAMKAETKTVRCLKKTPSYKLTAHDGSIVARHHYTGHTHAIVYFLASAANARCRAYCQELSEKFATAKLYKTVVVAIAPEPVEELARAHQELGLSFPLLSDAQSEVAGRYGLVAQGWVGPA